MAGSPQQAPAGPDRWRVIATVVGFLIALPVVKAVEKALTPSLGEWGAFGVGAVAGAAMCLVVALVYWLLTRGGGGGAEPGAAPDRRA